MKEKVVIGRRILADISFADSSEWIVIFCHGYKGYKDWGAWNLVAETFAEHGIDFLKFNFSLNGGTLNDPIDFPDLDAFGRNTYSQEVTDAHDVVAFVSKSYPDKKIALLGHSRGGGIATLVAAQNKNVQKLITWASVSDFKSRFPLGEELETWRNEGVRYVVNGRTKQKMPHYFSFYEDFIRNEEQLDIQQWASKLTIPHLIVHGSEDKAVDLSEAHRLHAASPFSELYALNTGHTFGSHHPWQEKILPNSLEEIAIRSVDYIK